LTVRVHASASHPGGDGRNRLRRIDVGRVEQRHRRHALRLDRTGCGNAIIGAAQGDVDGAVRRVRSRGDRRGASRCDQGVACRNRRGAADEAMTKGDQAIQSVADRLERLVASAQRSGGVKAKVADRFAEDPEFLRKLKPSLIAARAKGSRPREDTPPRATAPSGPQLDGRRSRRPGGGISPWLVVGAAFAGGYLAAKVIDWRSHAHPR
jgi:hypothetical protein